MRIYTKADLDRNNNKGQLVDLYMTQQEALQDAISGPLSAAQVTKKLLALSNKVTTVADNAKVREQEYNLNLKEMELQHAKDIKELELKYNSAAGVEAEELAAQFAALEALVETAKKDLSYGLEEAEADFTEKVEIASTAHAETLAGMQKAADEAQNALAAAEEQATLEISEKKVEHERTVESLTYDYAIALRDKDIKLVEEVADKHSMSVIANDELTTLKDHVAMDEEALAAAIGKETGIVKNKVQAAADTKYTELNNSTSNTIALLNNDKEHLNSTVTQQASRIEDLEDQVKAFPVQLKDAVAAAKADVNVNNDNAKK